MNFVYFNHITKFSERFLFQLTVQYATKQTALSCQVYGKNGVTYC
jgi:hypothetical protein